MKCLKLKTKNIGAGFLYFYIHFVTEVVCFFVLGRYIESVPMMWLIFFIYDMLAFVPQSIIGYINDKFPKLCFGMVGLVLLALALLLQNSITGLPLLSLVILCLGNAFIHVNGAEITLKSSCGKLSHSAIFVSGGSFGVVFGQLLATTSFPYWLLFALILSAVPFTLLAQTYSDKECPNLSKSFNYENQSISKALIVILAVMVVVIRGYMAYGIPTSWRKTTIQTIIFFVFMGIGKAMGGILSDLFGVKRIAMLSVAVACPLLMFGDKNMIVSLIGVMFFSMTMSISLASLVSVLPNKPGLAFGLTTIGLFIGAAPVFFFRLQGLTANCIMLFSLTVVCLICFGITLRKDVVDE